MESVILYGAWRPDNACLSIHMYLPFRMVRVQSDDLRALGGRVDAMGRVGANVL
jgi:hypothetical protein